MFGYIGRTILWSMTYLMPPYRAFGQKYFDQFQFLSLIIFGKFFCSMTEQDLTFEPTVIKFIFGLNPS